MQGDGTSPENRSPAEAEATLVVEMCGSSGRGDRGGGRREGRLHDLWLAEVRHHLTSGNGL